MKKKYDPKNKDEPTAYTPSAPHPLCGILFSLPHILGASTLLA